MIIENAQLHEFLKDSDWILKGRSIFRTFKFESFVSAVDFVNQIADIAETLHHDPKLELDAGRVKVILTSDDEGGVSAVDLDFATRLDAQY